MGDRGRCDVLAIACEPPGRGERQPPDRYRTRSPPSELDVEFEAVADMDRAMNCAPLADLHEYRSLEVFRLKRSIVEIPQSIWHIEARVPEKNVACMWFDERPVAGSVFGDVITRIVQAAVD